MTASGNPLTAPKTAKYYFYGYYSSEANGNGTGVMYVNHDGYITAEGIAAAKAQ